MKQGIHPEYKEVKVRCACGAEWTSHSTSDKLAVDICGVCHPFYTGKQKFVDAAGRVEKFQRKFGGDYFAGKTKKK